MLTYLCDDDKEVHLGEILKLFGDDVRGRAASLVRKADDWDTANEDARESIARALYSLATSIALSESSLQVLKL